VGIGSAYKFRHRRLVLFVTLPVVAAARWIFDLFLVPLSSLVFSLFYLHFTREVSYPSLAKPQNPASQMVNSGGTEQP
jgi:hypothetical protein